MHLFHDALVSFAERRVISMRDYSFGNFISTLRERKGLSQYQLGVLVDVSDKAVSKWENGESEPSIDKLIKLSKYFGVSIDESMSFR